MLSEMCFLANHHRISATTDQTISTSPKGQAPWRKPYIDPKTHDKANAKINQWLRYSIE